MIVEIVTVLLLKGRQRLSGVGQQIWGSLPLPCVQSVSVTRGLELSFVQMQIKLWPKVVPWSLLKHLKESNSLMNTLFFLKKNTLKTIG